MSGSPIPREIAAAVEAALGSGLGTERRERARIAGVAGVGGGCISPTARVTTEGGDDFFLKWDAPRLPSGLLAAEAWGLRALAAADAVRVPRVVATGDSPAWLLTEWLEPGRASDAAWGRLGAALAEMHRTRAPRFGAGRDNFIGSLPQPNGWVDTWPAFWRARRLEPQLRRARDTGLLDDGDGRRFYALFAALDEILAPADDDGPSLVHGDLWSGNAHPMADGEVAIIDPAVYHGHREVDLAMAALFGGFDAAFHHAYREAWPLAPGFEPVRRAVYQLYYLLVHVNLFGAGYVAGTRRALGDAGF